LEAALEVAYHAAPAREATDSEGGVVGGELVAVGDVADHPVLPLGVDRVQREFVDVGGADILEKLRGENRDRRGEIDEVRVEPGAGRGVLADVAVVLVGVYFERRELDGLRGIGFGG